MTISYVRSTFAQIPFVNTDKVRAVLQEYFYLPRPRFKAATKVGKLGSLEISGPGEFQCYGVDQEKLPHLNPDEIAVVGSDPGLDNFNWWEWGAPLPPEALLPKLAPLLESGSVWNVYTMTPGVPAKNTNWWSMRTWTLANINGKGRMTTRIELVPVPTMPVIVEVHDGVVSDIYHDGDGPVVLVDWDAIDDQGGDAQLCCPKPIAELRKQPAYGHVRECLDKHGLKPDAEFDRCLLPK